MKYNKTKYPNIYYYETAKGKRYYVRRSFFFRGKKEKKVKVVSQLSLKLVQHWQKLNNKSKTKN